MRASDKNSSTFLEVEVKKGDEAAALLDAEWDELLLKQEIPNPTCSAAWLRASIRLDESAIPLVVAVRVEGQLVGGGAFELKKSKLMWVARWLGGSGRPAIMPDLIIASGYEEAAVAILEALKERSDVISLGPSMITSKVALAFDSLRVRTLLKNTAEGWVVELPAPKIEKLKKKNASRIRRAEKQGVRISIKAHSEPRAIDEALGRLFSLHQSRWEGRNDMSRFSREDFDRRWTKKLVQDFAQRKQVRIVEVCEDDRPAAMVLGFLFGRGAVYHTPAVDPRSVLRGAGHVSMQAWVEAAQEAGAEIMSLGRGSGEPQSPKGALGPTEHPCGIYQIGSNSLTQKIVELEGSLAGLRSTLRRG